MNHLINNKLIVALDVETGREARELVAKLRGVAAMFKIGLQLFTAAGPSIVREIVGAGEQVFLDLKFHDIPNTVAAATREAVRLGVSVFDVHAAGGREMMRQSTDAAAETAEREGLACPAIIAVTVLTSLDAAALAEIGVSEGGQLVTLESHATKLACLADECGLNGIVASPHEIRSVRAAIRRKEFTIVTPGVRPRLIAHHDQKRVMTPVEAVQAGADYLVIGRAIINAADPARAAFEISQEISHSR